MNVNVKFVPFAEKQDTGGVYLYRYYRYHIVEE